ncbi:MAG: acetyl-CoA carboxylase biotin carboxylase subunit [Nitrospiria bacterium]
MFKKILIANRGEIALRIIQACKEMGIKTVAIHSEADASSLHVRFADEAVCVGPADSSLSYRNIPNILSAAEFTDSEAIHPGYGFLAESAYFSEVCESAGIKFIGPSAEAISLMGNKAKAREIMIKNGIPVIPGSEGKLTGEESAVETAKKIGYPLIIKASSGGGGRGMRVVNKPEDLSNAIHVAQAEALSAFGDDSVYMEKYFLEPRHIEIQVLADEKGHIIHLGERDCSIQRRHQKIIEETPSPVVDEATRNEMGRIAVAIVDSIGYVNAGTIEFLMDSDKKFYFIEMNTRIQVEHPITEMVTGVDLIREQIKIAAGRSLEFKQSQVKRKGHSFECRINAESPDTFKPSPGLITLFRAPTGPGVRVDSGIYSGYTVPPYYDSLIAKLIVWGENRTEAIMRMRRALDEFIVEGIQTTIPLHQKIFQDPGFIKSKYSTNYLDKLFANSH